MVRTRSERFSAAGSLHEEAPGATRQYRVRFGLSQAGRDRGVRVRFSRIPTLSEVGHTHLVRDCVESGKNPPTGRLGCIHFGLLETGRQLPEIPQPEGWGFFTLAKVLRIAAFPLG